MRLWYSLLILIGLSLAGCVTVETTSAVSASDIPANRYRKIAVFVENVSESEQSAAEQTFVSALRNAGIAAQGSLEVFNHTSALVTDVQKARIIRGEKFDAALYVTIEKEELSEEPVPDVWYDGQLFHGNYGPLQWSSSVSTSYAVDTAGKVVRPMLILATKCELQDVWSAKEVWQSETYASVNSKHGTMDSLFERAAEETVEKLEEDHAI